MNPRELVDHILSGPVKLMLNEPLRFRRRTRSNPCDFNEFLQALQSSETIRDVSCLSHRRLGISKDEWFLLVRTLGSIKNIQNLVFGYKSSSRDFHPFRAVADAVNNAQSLCKLGFVLEGDTGPGTSSGVTALASALRKHTALQEFGLVSSCRLEGALQSTAFDPVLQVLSDCPHLQQVVIMTTFVGANAIRNLLHLPKDTSLQLTLIPDHWSAVADEIRQGRCHMKGLELSMVRSTRSEATEAVKAIASAIREDTWLEKLSLQMENGYTNEAGVALAEALTVNKTLRELHLADVLLGRDNARTKASLGAEAYEAISTMLRVNTRLVLKLPPFKSAGADERLLDSRKQIRIEQRLNQVGRGSLLLSTRQTTREEWVWALHDLNTFNVNESLAHQVSCLYSLLRSDPSIVQSSVPYVRPLRRRAYSI
jgi:hypothetical protein